MRRADAVSCRVATLIATGVGIAENRDGIGHGMLAPRYADKMGRPDVRFHQASRDGGGHRAEMSGERCCARAGVTHGSRLRLAP